MIDNFDEQDIFVIHGRNIILRNNMFKFLESLGLHPISFEEAKQKTERSSIGSFAV